MTPGQADSWGQAFAPSTTANSQLLNVTAANTPVAWNGSRQVLIFNSGTAPLFFAPGAVAAAPTVGTPANGVPVAQGSTQTFTLPPGTTVIGIITAAGTTTTVYITPGEGE